MWVSAEMKLYIGQTSSHLLFSVWNQTCVW